MRSKIFKIKPLHHAMLLCLTVTPLAAFGMTKLPAKQSSPQRYDILFNPRVPRLTFNAQSGSYTFGQVDLMYPILGRSDNFMFLDVRGEANTKDAQEYNLGLGYRGLVRQFQNPFIAGGYVWVDRRRSKNGNYYDQATAGLEYLSRSYDVRANIYIPYGNHSYVLTNTYDPFATGYTVGYVQNQRLENSLNGLDIEAGKVDLLQHRLRLYADYYHFGVGEDPVRMNGGRARTEFILENRWLDTMGSNLIFTASYQYDNVRHSAAFAGVRLNIGKEYKPVKSLVGRIEDLIIRDDDIVLANSTRSQRYTNPSRFIFVDNSAAPGGDGSFEHPYQQEITAQNVSQPGDSIYTFTGNGPYSMPVGGLTLKSGQFFYGAGADVTYNNVIVLPATVAPVLNGRMNITNGNFLSGFTLSGTGVTEEVGIYGSGISHVSISDVTVQDFSGASDDGAYAYSSSVTATGGAGGTGKIAIGIDLTGASVVTLTNVTVANIAGGSANGGDARAIRNVPSVSSRAQGGNGGVGGGAVGIGLSGSSRVVATNLKVTNILGGAANSGDAASTTYAILSSYNDAQVTPGGTSGNAVGIDLSSSSNIFLNNTIIQGVLAGSADGGNCSAITSNTTAFGNVAFGGYGGVGGTAIGIDLSGAQANVSTIQISHVAGGSALGGDVLALGNVTNKKQAYDYTVGKGGGAFGVLADNSVLALSSVSVSNVNGGAASSRASTANGVISSTTNANNAYGTAGGTGGAAKGVSITNSSVILSDIEVSSIAAGDANGAQFSVSGPAAGYARSYHYSFFNTTGGAATGIDLTNSTGILQNATINGVTGGDANGGDAKAYGAPYGSNTAKAGGGGIGGDATGIKITPGSVVLTSPTVSGVVAGTAIGGVAVGNPATQGVNGTAGTATNIL